MKFAFLQIVIRKTFIFYLVAKTSRFYGRINIKITTYNYSWARFKSSDFKYLIMSLRVACDIRALRVINLLCQNRPIFHKGPSINQVDIFLGILTPFVDIITKKVLWSKVFFWKKNLPPKLLTWFMNDP